ncbi:tetratricopeptide repeat protein, partial [Amycolatopsis sp. NPDC058278]|uniref:tetratricopeptide repeat protein n=1 Tax=Amycolatopsis sp. NPDC058278 TaxID=3346417 RepID=UPI0036DBDEA7
ATATATPNATSPSTPRSAAPITYPTLLDEALVRDFAAAQAVDHIPETERRAAVVRLASAYLAVADLADNLIHPAGSRHQGRVHAPRYPVDPAVAERAFDPFRWFLLERAGIAAVVAACHRQEEWMLCWELADASSVGFENLRLWDIGRRCADLAYDAAQRIGSTTARAATLRNLGEIDRETGQHKRAVARLEESVALFQKVGDRYGVVDGSCNLSLVHMRWGNPSVAEGILRVALEEARSLADVRGEGWTWEILGESAVLRGDRTVGSQSLQSAATLLGDTGEQRGEAFARSNEALLIVDDIGWQPLPPVRKAALAADARPDVTRATELLNRAQAAFTTLGDDRNLALVAVARIRLLILENRDRDARRAVNQSRTMPGFELDWRLRGLLVHCHAILQHRANAAEAALVDCTEALSLVEPFGDRLTTACIRLHLGLLQRAAGHTEEATADIEAAHNLFQALDRAEATRTCEDLLRRGKR